MPLELTLETPEEIRLVHHRAKYDVFKLRGYLVKKVDADRVIVVYRNWKELVRFPAFVPKKNVLSWVTTPT